MGGCRSSYMMSSYTTPVCPYWRSSSRTTGQGYTRVDPRVCLPASMFANVAKKTRNRGSKTPTRSGRPSRTAPLNTKPGYLRESMHMRGDDWRMRGPSMCSTGPLGPTRCSAPLLRRAAGEGSPSSMRPRTVSPREPGPHDPNGPPSHTGIDDLHLWSRVSR